MDGVRAALIAIVMSVGVAAPGFAAPAQPATRSAPDKSKAVPDKRAPDAPPIAFYVAKGDADACGRDCDEWIAADGRLDRGAAARLRALLARLGKRKPPIYFHSPGGSVEAAMEIGRLMHTRGLKAGVGRTIPEGCSPKQGRDPTCDKMMRMGIELVAQLQTGRASCASACVYALLGAVQREVAPDAALGVHSVSVVRTMMLKNREGKILLASTRRLGGDSPTVHDEHERVARYAAEMGIGRALVDAAAAVPFEKIRMLTRDEIVRFGIDPRSFVEGRWIRDEDKSGRAILLKFAVEAGAPESKGFHTSALRLSCSDTRNIAVGFLRERMPGEKIKSVRLLAGGNDVALAAFGRPSTGSDGVEREMRGALTTVKTLEDAVKGDTLELVTMREGVPEPASRMKLSTAGLATQLATLGAPCF